jgi:uncharacterized protein YecT (DUF1311 family)
MSSSGSSDSRPSSRHRHIECSGQRQKDKLDNRPTQATQQGTCMLQPICRADAQLNELYLDWSSTVPTTWSLLNHLERA